MAKPLQAKPLGKFVHQLEMASGAQTRKSCLPSREEFLHQPEGWPSLVARRKLRGPVMEVINVHGGRCIHSAGSPREIQNYLGRISGPLLDRIDLHVEVPPVKFREISAERTGESSAAAGLVAGGRKEFEDDLLALSKEKAWAHRAAGDWAGASARTKRSRLGNASSDCSFILSPRP